jgi:hypothetical protein
MAVGDGVVWNEALPDNSTLAHQIDDYNRDLRLGVRSRMAREHVWSSSQTATSEAGHHQFVSFQQQTAAPTLSTALTQVGALYVGSSGLGYQLTFENSAGSTIVLVNSSFNIPVISAGTLGSIPICSAANTSTFTLLAGPTSTTANTYLLVSSNDATGGVAAPKWQERSSALAITTTDIPDYSVNTATNGYYTLPGAFVIQWGMAIGVSDDETVSFPVAFTNTCFSVMAMPFKVGDVGEVNVGVSNFTKTSFDIRHNNGQRPCNWFAIGY